MNPRATCTAIRCRANNSSSNGCARRLPAARSIIRSRRTTPASLYNGSMYYSHSREQSAEFLRQAVGRMREQEAGFDPASYTLWYEHAAGINAPLSQVLEQRLNVKRPLTD